MPRETIPGYYTRSQAMRVLNVTKERLQNFVRNGTLKTHTPPGYKQSVYVKKEVDALARQREAFAKKGEYIPTTFVKATPESMDEVATLIDALFNHYPNVERWKEYIRRNPDIGYLLRTPDKVVGCAFVFPLAPDRIAGILTSETTSPSILPEEILPYQPEVPTHLYVRAVGILPEVSKFDRRVLGGRLISQTISAFIGLGAHGIDIKTIHSRSNTVEGIKILRHLGFTEIPSNTEYHNFLIDVESSGLTAIRDYKKALETWKKLHSSD